MKTISIYGILLMFFFFNSTICHSQLVETENKILDSTRIKRINIGFKIGIPNVIGLNGEVLLPMLGNRVSTYLDYSRLKIPPDEVELFSYFEYGANFYFNQKGNGFFISLGQAKFDADLTFFNLAFKNGGITEAGSGSTDLNFKTTNIKLGVKTGGKFYFRFEVGFGLGNLPDTINFTSTSNGITQSFSEERPPIPGLIQGGILIGNVGFGLAF